MFDKILLARIGWGDEYQGVRLVGNFRKPNESGSWWERFNFKPSANRLCYGYVPPMGSSHSPPRPMNHQGWLVVVVATEDGRLASALLPVRWYEEATIENYHTKQPE